MITLKTILCPTDFSEPSLAATRYALEFARTFDAALHLLYVIEDPMLFSPAFGGYAPNPDEFEAYAKTGLENWISPEDAGAVPIVRRWVHGRPFLGILRDAERHDVDLIVMGTHGRGFLPHILLGSVAERVVREASCPVLTVRTEGFQYEAIDTGAGGEGNPV
ncbi:MAG: universal stress protein [Planctomycetaceae bacterium]